MGLLLAQRLGYPFVDSGAMYRAVTLQVIAAEMDLDNEAAVTALARRLNFQFVRPSEQHPAGRIMVDGQDVTDAIHTPAVDARVSLVARIAGVREVLVRQQRALAEQVPVVMVGRDIGTVVLPQADLKVYLDASREERATRRYRELHSRGEPIEFPQVLADLERRDRIDRERAVSPLRPAEDAVVIDTDTLTVERVVEAILDHFITCRGV